MWVAALVEGMRPFLESMVGKSLLSDFPKRGAAESLLVEQLIEMRKSGSN